MAKLLLGPRRLGAPLVPHVEPGDCFIPAHAGICRYLPDSTVAAIGVDDGDAGHTLAVGSRTPKEEGAETVQHSRIRTTKRRCCRTQQQQWRQHGQKSNERTFSNIRSDQLEPWASASIGSSHSGSTASHSGVVPLPSSGERYGAGPATPRRITFSRGNR